MKFIRCCSMGLWVAAVTLGFAAPWMHYLSSHDIDGLPYTEAEGTSSLFVQEPPNYYNKHRLDYTLPSQSPNQRIHSPVLRAFEQVVGNNADATLQVLSNGRQVSLGIIVDRDGWAVTKASQLNGDEFQCRLTDGTMVNATRKSVRQDIDIALLRLEATDLKPVEWHEENMVRVGGWLATLSNAKNSSFDRSSKRSTKSDSTRACDLRH